MSEDKKKKNKKKFSEHDPEKYINLEPRTKEIYEAKNSVAVITFGRFNPITIGHEKLVNKVISEALSRKAMPMVFMSHSQDAKKNPLSYENKIAFGRKAFGKVIVKSKARTIIEVAKELSGKFDQLVVVVGQDRIKEFETLLTKYNGKEYNFENIEVISAGARDPDAEGVEGMSASKMREFAQNNDFQSFEKGLPRKLKSKSKEVFDAVRAGMNLTEETLEERAPLSLAQRRKRAQSMRRHKTKIAAARKRASRRRASPEKLQKRAQRRALKAIRARLSKNKKYSDMSTSEKIALDKRLSRVSKSLINRIARRELPKVKKAEMMKFSNTKKEDLNIQFERFIVEAEDPDIGHMKGSQPAGYYRGVKKSVKDDRARHFEKHAKMDDDNPAAYKPAPGDKEAKTKTSKHTKKFKQMFGEDLVRYVYSEEYEYLDEGLRDILDKFTGLNRKKIQDVVDGLTQKELMTIVRTASPKSARRTLGPKDYAYWNAAYERLKTMNEASMKDMVVRKRPHMGLNKNGSVKIDKRFKMFKKNMTESYDDLLSEMLELQESVEDLFESPTKSIKDKAEKTGIPYSILKDVYDRGVAAWRTGHRPGTTPSQWGLARVNSFATKSSGTWGKADKDLAAKARKAMKEEVELFTLDEQFELQFLDEETFMDKVLQKIHKHVIQGTELGDIAYQISRARGVDTSSRELEKKYIEKYGKPATKKVGSGSALRKKYGFSEAAETQFSHGSYKTMNFDICPGATAAFEKSKESGADERKLIDAAKAVDRYLGIEKDLRLKDKVTQDDMDKMTDAVDAAKEEIKEAGLEGHDYHQTHINAVKAMMKKDMKENVATDRAKARIKAEKERDARKHDRMMDRAKLKDLRTKLTQEGSEKPSDREWGTDSLTKTYKKDTPGEDLKESPYMAELPRGSRVSFPVMKITGESYNTEGTVVGTDPNTMRLKVRDDNGMLYIVKHEDASLIG